MGTFIKDEPQGRPPKIQPYSAIRPITASAAVIKTNDKSEIQALQERKATQKWQEDAWEYFDAIGEIKYAFNLFANILSRIRIHAAYVENDDESPIHINVADISDFTKDAADKAMRAVFGGGRQAEILRKSGINILVVGECYLISEISWDNGYQKTKWRIVSTDELVPLGNGFALKNRRNRKTSELKPLDPAAFMGRIWREHPRYSDEPDSSMRALCDLCNELLLLSRTVRATAKSRLNAGALFVPDEFSVSQDVETDNIDDDLDAYVEDDHDEFEDQLVSAMTTPISDEGSASAVVPLLIRGPAEAGERIRLIKFERAFDPQLTNRADRALERILQGIELPKEIVTGLSNIKYSNAIQINESFYTAHIEPLVLMLCDVYRTIYLEPALIKAGCDPDEIDRTVIWYDPSGITTAPDKSTAANVGFDKGALSEDAWRRANGFSDDDAPTAMEKAVRIALQRGPVTPEFMDTVLRTLVPDLLDQTRANTVAGQTAPIPDDVNQLLNPGAQAPPTNPDDALGTGEAPAGLAEGSGAPTDPAAGVQAPPADPTAAADAPAPDSVEAPAQPGADVEAPTADTAAVDNTPDQPLNGDFADGFVEDNAAAPDNLPENATEPAPIPEGYKNTADEDNEPKK